MFKLKESVSRKSLSIFYNCLWVQVQPCRGNIPGLKMGYPQGAGVAPDQAQALMQF